MSYIFFFFFSSRRRHTRLQGDWSSACALPICFADIGEATVVTLFLYETLNRRLLPKLLRELAPGTRIVAHRYGFGDAWPRRGRCRRERARSTCGRFRSASLPAQNIVLSLAEVSGTTCRTSQCSTILPLSSIRKISMPGQFRSV